MASYAFDALFTDFFVKIGACALGGTLLHSTFCVLNDICDIDLDGQVGQWLSRLFMEYQG
jgi:4-hydroxybenzoate polyprenyltransferase